MLVETTGSFMLIDPYTRAEVNPGAPAEVPDSPFIRDRIDLGQLRLVTPKPVAPAKEKTK